MRGFESFQKFLYFVKLEHATYGGGLVFTLHCTLHSGGSLSDYISYMEITK